MALTSTAMERCNPDPAPVAAGHHPRSLRFSPHDQAAAAAFVKGDPGGVAAFVATVRAVAEDLAGPAGDDARVNLLAAAAATARGQQQILERLLGDRLAARDKPGVDLVVRALDSATHRLALAMKHLAFESSLRRRPSVHIHNANTVTFSDVEVR